MDVASFSTRLAGFLFARLQSEAEAVEAARPRFNLVSFNYAMDDDGRDAIHPGMDHITTAVLKGIVYLHINYIYLFKPVPLLSQITCI